MSFTFTPVAPVTFSHVQFQNTAPRTIYFELNGTYTGGPLQVINLPPWLEATNIYADNNVSPGRIYFTLSIIDSYANTMTSGEYNANIALRLDFGGLAPTYDYLVLLDLTRVVPLALSPSVLPFNFTIGNANPLNQTLNITSESNWTIVSSQTWVTLSQTTGVNSGQVFVGVNPVGLTVGQYSAIITVTDNTQIPKSVTVTLNVNNGDNDVTFLYVSPQNIEFVSQVGEVNSTTKVINIESSDDWTVTASESWLNVSAASGLAGISTIDVNVDTVALTDTTIPYIAQLVFQHGDLQKTVFVELFLVEFFQTGIESEALYFSDDRNKLQITNVLPNMFLYLEGLLNNGIQNIIYRLNAPYQNGIAKVLFGLETNVILRSVIPTSNLTTRIKNNITPVTIDFTAYNKQLNSGATTTIDSWSNIRFLTGKTPVETNKLCYVPSVIHLTKDAVLSLSALSATSITEIEITGDLTATLNTSIAENKFVYNAIINLSGFDLEVGNTINIAFGDVSTTVIIKPSGLEQTVIAFENEWKEYEFFECTGELEIDDDADATDTELQVEGTKQTKIVSIEVGKDYEINTGNIYSQSEIDWLMYILSAKRIFIYRDGNPIEITLSSKNLQSYKTRTAYNNYSLKFKKAIVE